MEFNLGFDVPKGNGCHLCEKYKVASEMEAITEYLKEEYGQYLKQK